jgi:tetratricopeptide (TPR) repeat protein
MLVLPGICLLLDGVVCADTLDDGLRYYQDGNYQAAIPALEDAATEDPNDASILYFLGLSYQRSDRHTEAVGALKRAQTLDPELEGISLALGMTYYELGLYANARQSLEQAVEEDPQDGPALLFLGLTHMALNNPRLATGYLQRAGEVDPDLEQVANLNLSEAFRRQGNTVASRTALHRAMAVNPNNDLGRTAAEMLEEDGAPRTEKRWSVSGGVGIEYDDNVTTDELDITSEEGDIAAILDMSLNYIPYLTDKSELELGYNFYQSLYSDLSDFDLQLHNFSAIGSTTVGTVDAGAAYIFSYVKLGGDSFMTSHGILPSAGFSILENWYHSLSYNYLDKDFDTNNSRDAIQHAVNFDSYYFLPRTEGGYASLGLRLEDENTNAPEFDYTGYYFTLALSAPVQYFGSEKTRVRFSYQYYLRDYANITPGIGAEREDNRHTVSLEAQHPLTRYLHAVLNYRYISADSNLITSDYSENILSFFLRMNL